MLRGSGTNTRQLAGNASRRVTDASSIAEGSASYLYSSRGSVSALQEGRGTGKGISRGVIVLPGFPSRNLDSSDSDRESAEKTRAFLTPRNCQIARWLPRAICPCRLTSWWSRARLMEFFNSSRRKGTCGASESSERQRLRRRRRRSPLSLLEQQRVIYNIVLFSAALRRNEGNAVFVRERNLTRRATISLTLLPYGACMEIEYR